MKVAKELKNFLTLIVVGRVIKPFGRQTFVTTPSDQSHFHGVTWSEIAFEFDGLWLVNMRTGEVLKKNKL